MGEKLVVWISVMFGSGDCCGTGDPGGTEPGGTNEAAPPLEMFFFGRPRFLGEESSVKGRVAKSGTNPRLLGDSTTTDTR